MKSTYINFAPVFKTIGWLLLVEGSALMLPLLVSLAYGEEHWRVFMLTACVAFASGGALTFALRRVRLAVRRREGYLLTASVWVVFSLVGMLPFMSGAHALGFTDAFFETVSGFTTTGATVIADVEALPRGLLFWRSLIQWIGGLGIILFILAALPALNRSGGISMFNAEVSGVTHDKLHPRIRRTSMSLWTVYISLTALLTILLWCGPMDLYDAVCQSFTTMSTGGFSTRNASIGAWDSGYVAWVITVFMFLGGVNFMLLYLAVKGDWRGLARNDVFRVYVCVAAVAVTLYAVSLPSAVYASGDAVTEAAFQVMSAGTSTGFCYGGYDGIGGFPTGILILTMLAGACAGSTSGGMKLDRFVVLGRNAVNELDHSVFTRHVHAVSLGGRPMSDTRLLRVMAFMFLYLAMVVAATMISAAYGMPLVDSLFASVSCIGNDGLGYGVTSSGYGTLPATVKWVYTALMLMGRLELFTVLVLFMPRFWRS